MKPNQAKNPICQALKPGGDKEDRDKEGTRRGHQKNTRNCNNIAQHPSHWLHQLASQVVHERHQLI